MHLYLIPPKVPGIQKHHVLRPVPSKVISKIQDLLLEVHKTREDEILSIYSDHVLGTLSDPAELKKVLEHISELRDSVNKKYTWVVV